jgi:hypothetical protein
MRYSKEILEKVVLECNNFSDVVRKFNLKPFYGNRQTAKKYVKLFNIDVSHFRLVKNGDFHKKYDISDILVSGSSYTNITYLKERLYGENIKNRKCELCGQGEIWNGKKMSLILDHINGKNRDHRIDNLRIICPNCDATLDTFSGKNVKHVKTVKFKNSDLPVVNKKIKNGLSDKEIGYKIRSRKVVRPNYVILIEDIKNLGYVGTGKKYGVSDNSIRKWVKWYNKYGIN